MPATKETTNALLRFLGRLVPIIPAPELFDLLNSLWRSENELDAKINKAFDDLSESSKLIEQLELSLKEREKKLISLKAEYERISELSKLTEAQANAVVSSLEKTLDKSATRERWIAFLINVGVALAIFLVGVLASDWLKAFFSSL